MSNKNQVINYKIFSEINKPVWLIKKKDGTIVERCRQKVVAIGIKNKLNRETFEEYILERDDSYRFKGRKN